MQVGGSNHNRIHIHATTGTTLMRGTFGFSAIRSGAAMGTEFRANKDHAKAGGASDRGQARAAMLTVWSITRGWSAAHRAVECFSGHGGYDAWESDAWQSGTAHGDDGCTAG